MATSSKGPRTPITVDQAVAVRFNTIDWFDDDYTNLYSTVDVQKSYYNREHNKEFNIFSFGVTEQGNSVCCRILKYRPYFYVMIPAEFNEEQMQNMLTAFDAGNNIDVPQKAEGEPVTDPERFYSKYYKSAIVQEECRIYEREIFWKFMNRAKFKFLRLTFTSKSAMNFYYRALLKPIDLNITGRYHQTYKYNLFEADMEPVLRFYHDRDIKPSGWLECDAGTYTLEANQSKCQINIGCQWDRVMPVDLDLIAPLRIASFDIEADSSHGDFPIARKDCKKLANQLVIAWLRDTHILEKEPDTSSKYLDASTRLDKKAEFFAERIKKALMMPKYAHVDNDIDCIFLKGCYSPGYESNIQAKYAHHSFTELCQDIYNICNRELKKVKADKLLKSAMKRVEYKELDHIKLNGYITLDELINICKQTASYYKLDNPDDLINKVVAKDTMVRFVNNKLNSFFGKAYGDRVIQIGTVFWEYGDAGCFHNNIITLKSADSFNVSEDPCEIISFDYKREEMAELAESQVLMAWTRLIEKYDPDIIVGYNIHGFDMSFMFDRALETIAKYEHPTLRKEDKYALLSNSKLQKFLNMGRLHPEIISRCESARGGLVNKKLSSSALGDNFLFYFNTPGRVQIDLLKVAQSSMTKLPSYKLDDVASFYISGKIKKFYPDPDYPAGNQTRIIKVTNIAEIDNGNFVIINMANTGQQLYDGEKIAIREIDREHDCLTLDKPIPTDCMSGGPLWGLAKDDVSAKDIFRLQKGTNQDRATIAKYCIQDCVLLIRLLRKLDVIPNNVGMSNVCLIPFSYIFLRGQGIKIFSLVVNETAKNGYILPTLEKILPEEEDVDDTTRRHNTRTQAGGSGPADDEDVGDDVSGTNTADGGDDSGDVFQLKSDFNVIKVTEDGYEGAIVLTPKPNIYFEPITVLDFASLYPSEMIASDLSHDRIIEDDCWLGDEGIKRLDALGYDVLDRSYDNYSWVDPKNKNKGKYKNGVVTIRYVQTRDGSKGLIPRILQKLLTARKKKKKEMEAATDPFKKTILEGLQLAYKLTANSLYGQIGAQTSKIYKKEIAASTTAGGRINIYKAKDFVLKNNPGCEVVYGDTDSVFVKLNLVYPDGTYPEGREDKIQRSIDIGLKLQQQLKDEGVFRKPHDLEYEKVFYPLILITKKRYIGIKYEFDPKEGKKTSMGVVTKRRDNAPILKHTFNGVVDTLTQDCNLTKAIKFVQETCRSMVDGVYDLNMFVISKTLREYYKDPESIAHKVLAMRMGERDPGTKPASNERIPYVYIKIEEKPGVEYLQGDRIEHINYVRENKCQVDHQVYIMNQLMKPISQIFELVVELIPGFAYARDPAYFINLENHYYNKFGGDLKKTAKKISDIKKEHVQRLVFQPLIDYAERKVSKRATLDKWLATPQTKALAPAPETEQRDNPDDAFANIDLSIPSHIQDPVVKDVDISSAVSQPKEKIKATIKKTKQGSLDSFFGVKKL